MANSYIETRIAITRVILIVLAVLVAGLFVWGAVAVPEPGWFVAVPVDLVAIALVLAGSRRRGATRGASGGGLMAVGGVLVVASIVLAFAVGNAT